MKKVASLKYGVVFKKAFCDPEIFSAFTQDMIGQPVSIDHVETEKEFDPPIGYVKPRFDLFAEDTEHRLVVDIQHARSNDHYDRFLYYHCAALLEQVANSRNYRPPLTVYTLVVLTSGDRHQCDIAVTDFDPHNLAGKPLLEIPHKVIYLCPKYVTESTPEPYRKWLRAINDTLDEEVDESQYPKGIIQKLFESIRRDQLSPEERARMIEEYNQEELQQTKFEEGVHKGEKKKAVQIARKLLTAGGLDVQSIAAMTDLSEEEIAALR
ncbi:MAG: PD-(D/E)XK nuclease family transposase [Candidatus Electrothrix sp.]